MFRTERAKILQGTVKTQKAKQMGSADKFREIQMRWMTGLGLCYAQVGRGAEMGFWGGREWTPDLKTR